MAMAAFARLLVAWSLAGAAGSPAPVPGQKESSEAMVLLFILGLYIGIRENGNYYNGLYRDYRVYIGVIHWDNGKEAGNYYMNKSYMVSNSFSAVP